MTILKIKSGPNADWVDVPAIIGPAGPQGIQGEQGIQGPAGPTGATGPQGAKGDTGEGLTAGGSAGQFLTKASSTDFDCSWTTPDFASASDLSAVANSRIPDALVAVETTPSTNNTINWLYE